MSGIRRHCGEGRVAAIALQATGRHAARLVACAALLLLVVACSRGGSPEAGVAEARKLIAAGNSAEARILLKNVVQDHPDAVAARILLARIALDGGDAETAGIEAAKVTLDPKADADSVRTLIEIDLAKGESRKARERIEKFASTLGPADVAILGARAHRRDGDPLQGVAILRAARAASGAGASRGVDLELAAALADAGALEPAARLLEERVKTDAKDADALLARGTLRLRQGATAAAATDLEAAIRAAPSGWPRAQLATARVLATEALLSAGRIAEARTSLEQLQRDFPGVPAATLLDARAAMIEGRVAEAVAGLRKAATAFPDDRRVQLALSEALAANGNLVQAIALLEKRIALAAGDAESRGLLAQLFVRQGRPDKAAALYAAQPRRLAGTIAEYESSPEVLSRRALSQAKRAVEAATRRLAERPDDAEAERQLVLALVRSGDLDGARARIARWPTADTTPGAIATRLAVGIAIPDEGLIEATLAALDAPGGTTAAQAFTAAADVAAALSRRDLASTLLTRARERFPKDTAVGLRYAALLTQEQDLPKARQVLEQMKLAEPDDAAVVAALADTHVRERDFAKAAAILAPYVARRPAEPSTALALARALLGQQKAPEARATLDAMVAAAPKPAEAANAAGLVLLEAREFAAAREQFASAVRQSGQRLEYQLNLARAEALGGDREAAVRTLAAAGQADGGLASSARVTVPLLIASGKLDQARTAVAELLRADDENPVSWFLKGEVELRQQRWKDADAAYARAQALYPNVETALRQHQARLAGKLLEPAGPLQGALTLDAGNPLLLNALASHHIGNGSPALAKAPLEAVLKRDPANVAALNNLAWILAEDDATKALPLAQRAQAILPENPAVADTYGWVLHRLGRTAEARSHLQFASQELPKEPGVQYHLAAVEAALGNTAEARSALRRALDPPGSFPERAAAMKLNGELR
jgi:putative PEP-CTERM system TPR-repeat lipoprotein